MAHQLYCYDFTCFETDGYSYLDVAKVLARVCKKFVFQLETAPTTKKLHWQGRVSLTVKKRLHELKDIMSGPMLITRWSPTSQKGKATFDYVMKEDTRVEGPWSDKDWKPPVMPAELKAIAALFPWQQAIVDDCSQMDEVKRKINVIVDVTGGQGKGLLRKYLHFHKIAKSIPTTTRVDTIMAWAMKFPARAYIVDMPRGTGMKKDVIEMWRGLECLKDGRAYETRYVPQDMEMEFAPHIWVMTNEKPDMRYLSTDRWVMWLIDPKDQVLMPYSDKAAQNVAKYNEAKARYLATKPVAAPLQRTKSWEDSPPEFMPPQGAAAIGGASPPPPPQGPGPLPPSASEV